MELSALFLVLVVVLLLCLAVQKYRTASRIPIAPCLHWLMGHFQLMHSEESISVMRGFVETLGPIFRLRFINKHFVIVNSSEGFHEALVQRREEFAGRPFMDIVSYISSEKRNNLFFGDWSPDLRQKKTLAMKALGRFASGRMIAQYVNGNFEKLEKILSEEPVDPEPLIYSMVYSVLGACLFGKVTEFDDPELVWLKEQHKNMQGEFMKVRHPCDLNPKLADIETSQTRRLMKRAGGVLQFYTKKIADHLEARRSGKCNEGLHDIVDHLIEEMKVEEQEDKNKSFQDIRQIVRDIFFAGTETTRNQFLFMLLFLALHPEWQTKLYEELQQETEETSKTPLMSAFISESERCGTVQLLTPAHQTTCDTELLGYRVPQGSSVCFNLLALHHDPKLWTDPKAFRPERFLENGVFKSSSRTLQPFSVGVRRCAGEHVAKSILRTLLRNFVSSYVISMDPKDVAARGLEAINWYNPNLFFGVPVPFKLSFRKRENIAKI